MTEIHNLEEYRREKAIEEGRHEVTHLIFFLLCEATNTEFKLSHEDVSLFDHEGNRIIIHFTCPACGRQDEVII